MTDTVPPEVRSRVMAAVKGKDTAPEMAVRRGLHALGFRYSLHSRKLPGKPDLLLPKYRTALFVHGCFWHGHGCPARSLPTSRADYWRTKIERNRSRDIRSLEALQSAGWRTLVIWECALSRTHRQRTIETAADWLRSGQPSGEIDYPDAREEA